MTMRPYSIIPKTNKKNTGATTANSTTAAPRRLFARGAQARVNSVRRAPGSPEPSFLIRKYDAYVNMDLES
jgi:hypothetical protein